MRILIADDDGVCRWLLRNALAPLGYDVQEVGDGDSAWRAISGGDPPALALVDWLMPGIDGPEVCRRIRSAGLATYSIVLTVRDGKHHREFAVDAGADDFITKPFVPEELVARVRLGWRIATLERRLAATASPTSAP